MKLEVLGENAFFYYLRYFINWQSVVDENPQS